jgi:hypothetical protein
MRSPLLVIALASSIAAWGGGAVVAQSITGSAATGLPNSAPIGHLQPRAQQFSPRSAAEQAEQQKMSAFDAQQQKLDEELDKSLNICRC